MDRPLTGGIGKMGLDGALAIAAPLDRPLAIALPESVATGRGWRGKRLFDVVAALALIVLLSPIFLLVAAIVALTSRGPVLFRHVRTGRGGRTFKMLKFRTMHPDAEQRLASDAGLRDLYVVGDYKIPSVVDPRVTRAGRILRWLSADELPQLLNVVAGDMSLVGPRPVTEPELAYYGGQLDAYLASRPGVTGLWQVSGRNSVKFPDRADLDARYARECSPWLDLSILSRTPLVVLTGKGVK